jgi:hypothetical protein
VEHEEIQREHRQDQPVETDPQRPLIHRPAPVRRAVQPNRLPRGMAYPQKKKATPSQRGLFAARAKVSPESPTETWPNRARVAQS